jgi:hypothetical protein
MNTVQHAIKDALLSVGEVDENNTNVNGEADSLLETESSIPESIDQDKTQNTEPLQENVEPFQKNIEPLQENMEPIEENVEPILVQPVVFTEENLLISVDRGETDDPFEGNPEDSNTFLDFENQFLNLGNKIYLKISNLDGRLNEIEQLIKTKILQSKFNIDQNKLNQTSNNKEEICRITLTVDKLCEIGR